ncbi:MAG: NUDIX domain-containing protein [Anaerolineae bacterium]
MRYLTVPRTLCFLLHGDDVLLIQRARHKRLFPGKVNGVGGHVEPGEDVAASAAREIYEESGLAVDDLWLAGVVHVDGRLGQADALPDGVMPGVMLFVFTAQARSRDAARQRGGGTDLDVALPGAWPGLGGRRPPAVVGSAGSPAHGPSLFALPGRIAGSSIISGGFDKLFSLC